MRSLKPVKEGQNQGYRAGPKATAKLIAKLKRSFKMLSNILTGYSRTLFCIKKYTKAVAVPNRETAALKCLNIIKSFRYAEKFAESVAPVGVPRFQKKAQLPS